MASTAQARHEISSWTIAGACIVGFTLAAFAAQFSTLVDIPGWAAFVMVCALTAVIVSLVLTRPGHRGKALVHQCKLLGMMVFFGFALGAVEVLAILVHEPEGGVRRDVSGLVATWVLMFGGSLMLAAMAAIDARWSRKQ